MVGAFLEGCPDLIPNIPHSKTDDAGHFLIDVSPLCGRGQYAVNASKEEEGCPDVASEFYGHMTQTVSLTPPTNTATVAIRLGPKAGTLFGSVTDAVTGDWLDPCAELALVREPDNLLLSIA
jgi:hypothetical protein